MELHPGFRFHPTDEELITHYLSKKVLDCRFSAIAIGEVDMNKVEPWELPWKAKWGEKEWYFFCVRDKKYPTGLRTNRATVAGYWKATGKDKEILRGKTLVGMKKTLVFYKGRAPKGVKSNWVIHEYRLQGKLSLDNLPTAPKNDWVISRVFHKTSGGKKVHISALMRTNPSEKELAPSTLPPLVDTSPHMTIIKPEESESRLVPCFSNPIVFPQKSQENTEPTRKDAIFNYVSNPIGLQWGPFHGVECESDFQFRGHNMVQDQPSFSDVYGSNGFRKGQEMVSVAQETAISIGNSSAISNLGMGQQSFGGQEAPPIGSHNLVYTWSY